MLDKKTLRFLKELRQLCGDNSYKVVDVKTLVENAPKRLHLNEATISDMLKYLEDQEYIDIKYSEKKTYCLSILTKGRVLFEKVKEDAKTKASYRKFVIWNFILSAVAAFGGAFLAIWLF